MQKPIFHRNPLAASVALALGATAFSPVVVAQEEEVIEEIVTTGIRSSLMNSMNTKRNSDGVVDAITAEDIGKFPDTNLAESLQRITGVSIDRSRGEGSKVTVRGFGPQFNLVTLNGRQMPTHSALSRSFDFADLAAEGVAGVEVYKTSNASLPTGGIGSTINIKTTRPLDLRDRVLSFGVKGVNDTSTDSGSSFTPEISGIYGDTFANDTIGVSLSAIYQERDNGLEKASVNGWTPSSADVQCCDWGASNVSWGAIPDNGNQVNRPAVGSGAVLVIPQQLQYTREEFTRKRINSQLTLQWEPVEDITTTLDYTFAQNELDRSFNDFSSWFAWGNAPVQFSEWTNTGDIARYDEFNGSGDTPMGSGLNANKSTNSSVGFNFEWRPTDRLSLEFDYHDSTAEVEPNSPFGSSMSLAITSGLRESTYADWTTDLPELRVDIVGGGQLSANDMLIGGSVFSNNWDKMDIDQAKIAGTFDFNDIASVNFGIQTTNVDNRSASTTVQRDTWGGVGAPGDIADLLSVSSMAGWFDEIPGGTNPDRQNFIFTWDTAALIQRARELEAAGTFIAGNAINGSCGDSLCPSFDSRVGNDVNDKRTQEEQVAVYAQLNLDLTWGDRPVNLDLGLRYEETDVTSQAQVPNIDRLEWVSGNEISVIAEQDASGRAVLGFTQLTGKYDHLLPNVDFNIEVIDDVLIRASYSQTIGRPGYDAIQGGITVAGPCRVDGCDAFSGNPGLLPLEAQNTDLSVEWYFDEASYAAVGYFYKDVANFPGSGRTNLVLFPELTNPAQGGLAAQAATALGTQNSDAIRQYIADNFAGDPSVSFFPDGTVIIASSPNNDPTVMTLQQPLNEREAIVDGWELALQHTFGETGFGFIANATFVDADVAVDVNSLEPQFALPGLSDSANFVAFYDKDGIQARIAYNWRDTFLNGFGMTGSNLPRFTEEYSQWDVNASYDIGDNYTVFVEGINITGETSREHTLQRNMLMQALQTGPRYTVGFRGAF
ncbi:MAG: TonB-dependent receptor [Woeseiaceae bacterium]|nr:TonB-dependent receptor [Woeseiaceae bacterium]